MKIKNINNIIFVAKDKIKGEIIMELFKNVFLNTDKVVENTDIKITYAGKLFQNGAQNVQIHYGYGEGWENAQDVQMEKTELGYQTNIHIEPSTTLNFCFKNEYGEWDNNDGKNFTFEVEKTNWYEAYTTTEGNTTTNGATTTELGTTTRGTTTTDYTPVADEQSLCKTTPTWTELIKKTFTNIINYITKIFSGKKQNVNDDNEW